MDGLAASMPCREREHEFLFSVIVPVYKTEEYVEETLESVINQTIGFEKNIQLILVNNATPDGAGEICKHYLKRYPNNVLYIDLPENLGPSGARNAGIPYIKGKYVNFLDSDDKWALDAFEKITDFFEQHGAEINMIACRIHCFDAVDDWTRFDYKFARNMVCDIRTSPNFMQFNGSSVVLKSEILDWHTFDEDSKYAEDLKFVSTIILQTGKYGILRDAVFHYRRRLGTSNSQMQVKDYTREWYLGVTQKCYLYLVQYSKERYGKVLIYVQYILMQELTWRITKKDPPDVLSETELRDYLKTLSRILKEIDDYIIWLWPHLWKEYKLVCLQLKYGRDILNEFECRKGALFFHNLSWCNFDDPSIITLVEHHVENNCLFIDGKINLPFPSDFYQIFIRDNLENVYIVNEYPGDESNTRLSLGEPCLKKRCFRARIPLKGISKLSFIIRWGEIERVIFPSFGKFSQLSRRLKHSYCVSNGYLFVITGKVISISPVTPQLHKQHECTLRKELKSLGCKRALLLRTILPAVKNILGNRKVWIISDRITRAKDNGEFFFRYLKECPQPNILPYFAISKKSPDYRRMKQYGKVIPMESLRYQVLFLVADCVISSLWGYSTEDPFGWHRDLIKDLFHYRYIYLDHALTKDDISPDVNKHLRNFSMWTTAAQGETASILNYPYGYLPDVPQTTGLARYDAIYPAIDTLPQKMILIAPTWRKNLVQSFDQNGMVKYSATFKNSDFFHFYNDLMNDERLLEGMRRHGYKGVFRLHPTISVQAKDFTCNDVFSIQPQSETYESEFYENALVVTDYSSLAMDYAYVKRAVIYAQFDKNEFYQTHSYHESYFDYERDGFGPVCYDYEDTVQAILDALEHDCKLDLRYMERRQAFFAHIDNKNCARICKAVLSLSDHGNIGGIDSECK